MAIASLSLRVNIMLSHSNVKMDFLKGKKRCLHSHHNNSVDRSDLEQKILLGSLLKKLVKARTEIDITNEELRRFNRHGKKARDAKQRLLDKLETIDSEMYQKLAGELSIKGFSTSSYYTIASQWSTNTDDDDEDDFEAQERAIDAEWNSTAKTDAFFGSKTEAFFGPSPPAVLNETPFNVINDATMTDLKEILRDAPQQRKIDADDVSDCVMENAPSNGVDALSNGRFKVSPVAKSGVNGTTTKSTTSTSAWSRAPKWDSDSSSDDDSSDEDEGPVRNSKTNFFFNQYLSFDVKT